MATFAKLYLYVGVVTSVYCISRDGLALHTGPG